MSSFAAVYGRTCFHTRTAIVVTGALLLPDRACGTCLSTCDPTLRPQLQTVPTKTEDILSATESIVLCSAIELLFTRVHCCEELYRIGGLYVLVVSTDRYCGSSTIWKYRYIQKCIVGRTQRIHPVCCCAIMYILSQCSKSFRSVFTHVKPFACSQCSMPFTAGWLWRDI